VNIIEWEGIGKAMVIAGLTVLGVAFGYYLGTYKVNEYIKEREQDIEDLKEGLKQLDDK